MTDGYLDDEYFDLWYGLWQIEQESESALKFGGDLRETLDFIYDLAMTRRLLVESLEPLLRPDEKASA